MSSQLEVRSETFESLAGDWERLLAESTGASVFTTPAWQHTWWQVFGGDACLKLLSVRERGALKGLAALMTRGNEVCFLGGSDLVDYHDFVHSGIDDRAFYRSVFDYLAAWPAWESLRLTSLPDWSPAIEAVPEAAEAVGWRVERCLEDVAPGMALPGTWDEYLAGLSKKDRHELRRKLRRLERAGRSEHVCFSAPDEIAGNLDDFLRLHRMSGPEKAEFMTPEREGFFRRVLVELAREGRSRLHFLEIDGVRVATSVCFVYGACKFVYNSGYDPEYRSLSVGVLNHALCIRASIEEGIRFFDFLRGDESYKYHLGAHDRSLYNLIVTR